MVQKFVQSLVKEIVKWTPSAASAGITIHAFLQHERMQAILLSFVTACTTVWIKFSSGFMEEAEKEAEKRGGTFAQWIFTLLDKLVNQSREGLVQRWQHLTSNFEVKYYQRLNYLCRNFETHGLDKERIRKLQQIIVPVNVAYRSLAQISPNLLRTSGKPEAPVRQNRIGDFLALMHRHPDYRRLAILGAPGSGKTTLLRYITLMYAIRKPRKLHPSAPKFIPALLYLREIYRDILNDPDLSLATLLTQWVQRLQKSDPIQLPKDWFAKKLKHGRCLILLDGLDEIADESERQKVSQWVDRQLYEYKEAAFILTSRPLGYEHAKLQEDVQVLEVEPLTDKQIEQFVHNWYLDTEAKSQQRTVDPGIREDIYRQADRLLAEIRDHNALQEMATNPLLLTMIATVHRRFEHLPSKRVDLYDEICQVLLEKRQRAKGIPDTLTARQKRKILQPLALALMCRKTRQFTLEDAQPLFQAKLANIPGNELTPAQFLNRLREIDALLAKEQEEVYEFAHLSFQEYLAAVEIKETNQEQILVERLWQPNGLSWWAETMRLYAASASATPLVKVILEQPTFESLVLACDFWRDQSTMAPAVQKGFLQKLNEPLASLEPTSFEFAARVQPRYFKLAHYLQTAQWKEADYETYVVMCQVIGKQGYEWEVKDIQNFRCEDLCILDQLWVQVSGGRFGFSVQRDIYVDVGGKLNDPYNWESYVKFSDRIKWREEGEFLDYDQLTFDLTGAIGHLPGFFGGRGLGAGFGGFSSLVPRLANCNI